MSVKTFRWVIWFIVAGTSSLAGATGLEDFAHTRFLKRIVRRMTKSSFWLAGGLGCKTIGLS